MVHVWKELEAPSEDASNPIWQGLIYSNEIIWYTSMWFDNATESLIS